MWRPRDHERFIGSYDPEHEMPDPDRDDRWQSDAYRRGARDSRFAYRWNPDRFEERYRSRDDYERERDLRWRAGAGQYDRGYGYGYGSDYDRGRDYSRGFNGDRDWGRDYGSRDDGSREYGRDYGNRDYGNRDYGRDHDRGFSGGDNRDRNFGSDRGWDIPRRGGAYYEGDFGPGGFDEYDRDRWRRR